MVRSLGKALRLISGVSIAAAVVYGATLVPSGLSKLELFRVDAIEFEGVSYADRAELETLLAMTDEANIWDDLSVYEHRLSTHPLVRSARVRRALMSRLRIEIEEATPVALVPARTLEPVDAEGRLLPIDPTVHRLDLPVLHADGVDLEGAGRLTGDLRLLASEVGRYFDLVPEFAFRMSEVHLLQSGDIEVLLSDPALSFLLPRNAGAERIWDGIRVVEHQLTTQPDRVARAVDLRFAEQVVLKWTRVGIE